MRTLVLALIRSAALVVASIALGTCALLVPPTPSFEGWSPTPLLDMPPDLLMAAWNECAPKDGEFAVVPDQRTPDASAYLFVGTDGWDTLCLIARTDTGARVLIDARAGYGPQPPARLELGHLDTGRPTILTGTVPGGTERVTIETDSGLMVEATVLADRFLAWWPEEDPIEMIRAFGADGQEIEHLSALLEGEPWLASAGSRRLIGRPRWMRMGG